jgi:hypothetical protein
VIELVTMNTASGLVLWAHLSGQWAGANFDRLGSRIGALGLPAGSQVVLDFSAIDHLDYRAVPHLVRLGPCVERHEGSLRVVGLSEYLICIVAFGGALEGCEFLERYAQTGASRLARALPVAVADGSRGCGHAQASESVALWARSLSAAVPASGPSSGARARRGSRSGGVALRRARLAAFVRLVVPSRN